MIDMRWLSFAIGVITGMATNVGIAESTRTKEIRAYELNEMGIRLANNCRYKEALNYFKEAHKFMPKEFAIKQNIQSCKMQLRKIEEHKKQQEELKKKEEKEKLQRLRNKASKKSKKHIDSNKFPKETDKTIMINSKWCNSCCTNIPNDVDYCPYCGSIDIE